MDGGGTAMVQAQRMVPARINIYAIFGSNNDDDAIFYHMKDQYYTNNKARLHVLLVLQRRFLKSRHLIMWLEPNTSCIRTTCKASLPLLHLQPKPYSPTNV